MLGDFLTGFTNALGTGLAAERERQRQAEDDEINSRVELLKQIASRPDFKPEHFAMVFQDINNLIGAKGGKGKVKKGMAGVAGQHELPISQFLQAVQQHVPPNPGAQAVSQGFDGASVLGAPIAVPPPGIGDSTVINSGLKSAANTLGQEAINPGTFPPPPPKPSFSPFYTPDEMADQKAHAAARGAKTARDMEISDIQGSPYLTASQKATATGHQYGLSTTDPKMFLGTGVKMYKSPNSPEPFPGTPLATGGIYNHNTGQQEDGAIEVSTVGSNRPLNATELAAQELFGNSDTHAITQEQANLLREFMNSDKLRQQQLKAQYDAQLRLWQSQNIPRPVQGTSESTGQGISGFMSSAQMGMGGSTAVPGIPTPPVGGPALQRGAAPVAPTGMPQPTDAPKPPATVKRVAQTTPKPAGATVAPKKTGPFAVAPEGGIIQPPTGATKDQAQALASIPTIMAEISNIIIPMNKKGGVTGKVRGTAKSLAGMVGMNDSANSYESAKKGFLAQLARFSGEKGVLTDPDVQRAASMLPALGDSPALTKTKLDRVSKFLSARMAGLPDPFLKEGAGAVLTPPPSSTIDTAHPTSTSPGSIQVGKYSGTVH